MPMRSVRPCSFGVLTYNRRMETREIVRLRHAIFVTPQALEACHTALARLAGDSGKSGVAWVAMLADGTTTAFASLDEVLAFANGGDRRLGHLIARVAPRADGLAVEVEFGGSGYLFLATIRGDEALVLAIKAEMARVAAEIRPRYAFVYHLLFEIAALVLGWVIVNYAAAQDLGRDLGHAALIVLHLAIFVVVVGLLAALRAWLYPRVTFAWGGEQARIASRRAWRPWALAGLMVVVLLALFARRLGALIGL